MFSILFSSWYFQSWSFYLSQAKHHKTISKKHESKKNKKSDSHYFENRLSKMGYYMFAQYGIVSY